MLVRRIRILPPKDVKPLSTLHLQHEYLGTLRETTPYWNDTTLGMALGQSIGKDYLPTILTLVRSSFASQLHLHSSSSTGLSTSALERFPESSRSNRRLF